MQFHPPHSLAVSIRAPWHRATVSTIALLAGLLAFSAPANAASYVVSSETELTAAITSANADGAAASTITLTSSFTIAGGSLPEVTKNLTIDVGTNTLTSSGETTFNVGAGANLTVDGPLNVVGTPGFATGGRVYKQGAGTLSFTGGPSSYTWYLAAMDGDVVYRDGAQVTFDSSIGPSESLSGASSSVTVTGAGTVVTDLSGSYLGTASGATLNVEGGARYNNNSSTMNVGFTAGTTGTVNVRGDGSLLNSNIAVRRGVGIVNVMEGGHVESANVTIGGVANTTSGVIFTDLGGSANLLISGAGSRWDNSGHFSLLRGSLSILDGGVVTTGDSLRLGIGPSATSADALVSGSGSLLDVTGNIFEIAGGSGTTTKSGSLTIADGGVVTAAAGAGTVKLALTAMSTATINIGGASGQAATGAGTLNAGLIEMGAGASTLNFNHTDPAYDFDVAITSGTGTGTINQIGSGKTRLTADQLAFTGKSNVYAGILEVNGTLGGTVDVFGGRLQGTGTIGSTINNAGGIIAPGNSIGVLTIAGDYVGSGGLVEIETVLGDDSSSTDLLRITGDTSGTSNVKVINVGGTGAPTTEGIRIIEVGGASDGVFSLQGDYVFEGEQAVVGGAYAYRLYQNGVSTPADGDWYLRSALVSVPTVTPPAPVVPLYQPGVPMYESYANVLQRFNALGTLQQRVGNRSWSGAGVVETGKPAYGTIEGNGVWGRIEAAHGKFNPKTSTSGADYDVDLWKLQAGADGVLYEEDAGRLIGGISAHYGTLSSDIASIFGDGSISSTGYGLGGTLTWYADNGFYLDGQAQVSWYDSDLSSRTAGLGLVSGNSGFGYGLSIEGGQRIALGSNWSITPQAQLAYSEVNFDDFTDVFGASVGLDRGSSLQGRLGVSSDYQDEWHDEAGQISRSHVYGIANLYYDFLQGSQTDVAGTKFTSENDPLWGGIGIGGSYNWGDEKYSLFGEASVNTSLTNFGDSFAVKGNAGLRVKF